MNIITFVRKGSEVAKKSIYFASVHSWLCVPTLPSGFMTLEIEILIVFFSLDFLTIKSDNICKNI